MIINSKSVDVRRVSW